MNNINKYTSQPLSKKIDDLAKKKGIELDSEYVWVLSKSTYDDEKPKWYLTTRKQTELFKFYSKPRGACYKFGKIKLIAKCDYEVISEIIPAYDIAELGEMLNKIKIDICEKPFLRYSIDRPAEHNYEIIDGEN